MQSERKEKTMNFKELRQSSGMNLTQFSKYFNIPYRTIQNWERGERQCPQYLLELMEYKLKHKEVRGQWECDSKTKTYHETLINEHCSVCGRKVTRTDRQPQVNYCPNCGAKMDK